MHTNQKRRSSGVITAIAGILLCGTSAFAETVQVQLVGTTGANDGSFFVLPYQLALNGQTQSPINAICYDALAEVSSGPWNANVLNFTEAATPGEGLFAGTVGDPNPNAFQEYLTVTYLASTYFTYAGTNPPLTAQSQVDLQHAIWDVFDPGAFALPAAGVDPYYDSVTDPTVEAAGELALLTSGHIGDYTFLEPLPYVSQYPPVTPPGLSSQPFIIYTPGGGGNQQTFSPEPGSAILLGIGVGLIGISRFRSRKSR